MNIPIINRLRRISDLVRQYIEKIALIKQLESLSDHELQDAGIVRGSIPIVVDALYASKDSREDVREQDDLPAAPKLQIVRQECAHC